MSSFHQSKPTVILSRTWQEHQSWHRETLVAAGQHRLQVRVIHNAFQHQSSAIVKRWSGERWERVASIPPQQMRSWAENLSYAMSVEHFHEPFRQDEADLLTTAYSILGVSV